MEMRETRERNAWRIELVEGETSISRCWVVDRQVRIGATVVRTGGIGGVGTLPEHRGKGYARQVLEAAMRLLQRERYEISLLHGIQDFYHRFGFITCMAEHEFSLDTRDAERAPRGLKSRPCQPGDLPQIARIYNRDNAKRTGSVVRDRRQWKGFDKGTWWNVPAKVQVVVDNRDQVCGYVVYDQVQDRCRAAEVGGRGEEVFAAILHFMARRAVKLRRERVWFNVPADHPFALYCRDFGLRLSALYPRNGGLMGRIVDFSACLRKVLPELEQRWGAVDRDKVLSLRTEIGGGTLYWQPKRLVFEDSQWTGCVRLRQDHLMQLLMGYVRASDLVGLGRIRLSRDRLELMERLFPLQEAQMWWPDRF